jgi:hypothetical protein
MHRLAQLAALPGRSHNGRMKAVWAIAALAWLAATGVAAAQETVTVHRCVDGKGHVTLQDEPCPQGAQDSARQMTRPKDPPKQRPGKRTPIAPAPLALPEPPLPPARELIPPPPMYRCMSYDGIERFSEQYDPNPRCEPYVLYYPYPNLLTPAQALTCRWVEDSCVRLSDRAACERWRAKKKEATSAVLHSFSDTAAYRKSELERATQIVEESCP